MNNQSKNPISKLKEEEGTTTNVRHLKGSLIDKESDS